MTLVMKAQDDQLLANGRAQRAAIDRQDQALDFKPEQINLIQTWINQSATNN